MNCNKCGVELSPNTKFCNKCGEKQQIAKAAPPPPRRQQQIDPNAVFCRNCNKKLGPTETRCKQCSMANVYAEKDTSWIPDWCPRNDLLVGFLLWFIGGVYLLSQGILFFGGAVIVSGIVFLALPGKVGRILRVIVAALGLAIILILILWRYFG